LSPGCESGADALGLMMRAFDRAGLRAGDEVAIAIDVAASTFADDAGGYRLAREGRMLSSAEMVDMVAAWVDTFPVVSVEDGLGEDDWAGWQRLTAALGNRLQLVGDDLFATNAARFARGIHDDIANAVLVKANQNGTLSGTLDVIARAKAAGYATIVSARSGETEDAFMADLAVGTAAGQVKIGSLRTSSTIAKYNQLLRIDEHSHPAYAGGNALAKRMS
jgi:enolase